MKTQQSRLAGVCGALLLATLLAGCTHPQETQDERIQRQAAEAARQVRHDAQNAGVEAGKAAREAGREARDIVAGVRQGWREGASPHTAGAAPLDLNTASTTQLVALPGVTAHEARAIVRGRPYRRAGELVSRGILTADAYERVADRVTVRAHAAIAAGPE